MSSVASESRVFLQMPEDPPTLDARVRRIRDLVNDHRRQAELAREPRRWNQLCSCMDAIGDAEHAIDAHAELTDDANTGQLYLAHYGFVQALFLQQDAVAHLCTAFGFSDLADCLREELSDVRGVRNDVAHMTDREHRRFVGIVQMSMTATSFFRYSFGDFDVDHGLVDCGHLAGRQHAVVGEVLDQVVERLREDEREHRARFRAHLLADPFHASSYSIGKLAEGARHAHDQAAIAFAMGALGSLDRAVEAFAAGLEERGRYPGVNAALDHDIGAAREALTRMRELLSTGGGTIDAEAMVLLVREKVGRLEDAARSYDRMYGEDP